MTSTRTITVTGMTCEHCVAAVEEEVGKIAGITAIAVDLISGRVTIESAAPVADDVLAAAVDEAGYEVAP